MPRTDLFIKVVIDHDRNEKPEKLAAEVCRQAEKVYGVRKAELTNFITQPSEE